MSNGVVPSPEVHIHNGGNRDVTSSKTSLTNILYVSKKKKKIYIEREREREREMFTPVWFVTGPCSLRTRFQYTQQLTQDSPTLTCDDTL